MAVPLLHKHRVHTYIHTCARVKARPKVHRKFPFKWVIQITRLSEMTPRLLWWSKNRPFAFTCTFNSFSSLRPSFLYIQILLLCGELLAFTSRGGGEHDTISESAWARRQAGETSARYRQSQKIPLVSTKSAYAIRREYWFVFAAKSIDESSTSVYKQCATTRSFSINSQYVLPDFLQTPWFTGWRPNHLYVVIDTITTTVDLCQ